MNEFEQFVRKHSFDIRTMPPIPGVTRCVCHNTIAPSLPAKVASLGDKQHIVDFLNNMSSRLGVGTRHSLNPDGSTKTEAFRDNKWIEI